MGAPDFAVPALDALVDLGVEQGVEIVAVYTRTPKPGGRRGLELTRTAVHQRAEALGLRVLTPTSLRNAEAQAEFAALAPDAAVVAAYGLILPPEILATPRLGCVTLHGSLLPRWRGAAPIQRAIMAGDAETGVGLMRMEAGLDTGPVAREARMRIRPEHTAGDLTKTLAQMSGQLLRECWSEFAAGTLAFAPQSDVGVEYAKKIDKRETPIDWSRDAVAVRNHIHGLSPSPGAYSEIANGATPERIKFLRVEVVNGSGRPGEILDADFTVACGSGAIRALEAQRAGKGPMRGVDILRGGKPAVGACFIPATTLPASA